MHRKGESRAGRLHSVIARAVWTLLLALLLLLCLTLCALTLPHHPPPVNTGDALLDAYLMQVIKSDVLPNPFFSGYNKLTEHKWVELETRFGTDPRYWQLAYIYYIDPITSTQSRALVQRVRTKEEFFEELAQLSVYQSLMVQHTALVRNAWYLEQSRQKGLARLPHLMTLHYLYNAAWIETAESSLSVARPNYKSTYAQRVTYVKARQHAIDAEYGKAEQQLLREIHACAPKHPLLCLDLEAWHAAGRGDMSQAQRSLEHGNHLAQILLDAAPATAAPYLIYHCHRAPEIRCWLESWRKVMTQYGIRIWCKQARTI